MQNFEYYKLGILAAMTLVHGGARFNLFCPSIYHFMSGIKAVDLIPTIEEVPDHSTREVLNQVL